MKHPSGAKTFDCSVDSGVSVVPSETNRINKASFLQLYKVVSELGRGKFAVVKRCIHNESGAEFAAKVMRKRRGGLDCRQDIMSEIDVLGVTRGHERFIQLVDIFESSTEIIIITDFIRGGDLFSHLVTEERIDESQVIRLLRQTLEGLVFLHDHNLVHMDIKPQNILLTSALPAGDVILCDLGLTRHVDGSTVIREIIGTPDYVPPEVLSYEPLQTGCDVWSVGVLSYVMLSGCSPFLGDTKQETFLNISQVRLDFPPELFSNISTTAQQFISQLLVQRPQDRPTALQCLEHEWLSAHSNQHSLSSLSPLCDMGTSSVTRTLSASPPSGTVTDPCARTSILPPCDTDLRTHNQHKFSPVCSLLLHTYPHPTPHVDVNVHVPANAGMHPTSCRSPTPHRSSQADSLPQYSSSASPPPHPRSALSIRTHPVSEDEEEEDEAALGLTPTDSSCDTGSVGLTPSLRTCFNLKSPCCTTELTEPHHSNLTSPRSSAMDYRNISTPDQNMTGVVNSSKPPDEMDHSTANSNKLLPLSTCLLDPSRSPCSTSIVESNKALGGQRRAGSCVGKLVINNGPLLISNTTTADIVDYPQTVLAVANICSAAATCDKVVNTTGIATISDQVANTTNTVTICDQVTLSASTTTILVSTTNSYRFVDNLTTAMAATTNPMFSSSANSILTKYHLSVASNITMPTNATTSLTCSTATNTAIQISPSLTHSTAGGDNFLVKANGESRHSATNDINSNVLSVSHSCSVMSRECTPLHVPGLLTNTISPYDQQLTINRIESYETCGTTSDLLLSHAEAAVVNLVNMDVNSSDVEHCRISSKQDDQRSSLDQFISSSSYRHYCDDDDGGESMRRVKRCKLDCTSSLGTQLEREGERDQE